MKFFYLLFFSLLNISCSIKYKTSEFKLSESPPEPDYSNKESWAVLPDLWNPYLEEIVGKPKLKKSDVFFIYPTLFLDKKNPKWNTDIFDPSVRVDILKKAVAYQASAWVKAANLYVPFYRQAHYRIFINPYSEQGHEAGILAYKDVRRAFEYYLKHYNQGKPIIIAAHSQGSLHAKKIIQEFFDGKPLQKKLIAAYLIGVKIEKSMFQEIKPLQLPEQTGGFVSWNTFKKNKFPKRYKDWFQGGIVTNPISWNTEKKSQESQHLGVLYSDKKIYPKSLSVEIIDGMIWSTLPKVPKRFLLSFIKNYHFADINLFWADIQKNAVNRSEAWFQQNNQ
mgnify:FL=1